MFMRILILLLAAASRLDAADAAGRYSLRGEREVGSELVLHAGGRFGYMLAYGAADYSAKGTWRQDGAAVLLTRLSVE